MVLQRQAGCGKNVQWCHVFLYDFHVLYVGFDDLVVCQVFEFEDMWALLGDDSEGAVKSRGEFVVALLLFYVFDIYTLVDSNFAGLCLLCILSGIPVSCL